MQYTNNPTRCRSDFCLQQLKLVGVSANGLPVYDRPKSHHHLGESLLRDAIGRCELNATFEKRSVQYPAPVGLTDCVATSSKDAIIFAQREGRNGLTRFVLDRKPEPCSSIVIICKQAEELRERGYILVTAFLGSESEPEPWDRRATPAALRFWSDHALIWNSVPVLPDTLTAICPWSPQLPAHG